MPTSIQVLCNAFRRATLGQLQQVADGPYVKDYARVSLTSGDITLNSTSVTAVSASLDLSLIAKSGDLIEYGWDAIVGNEAQNLCFDVYTMVGGSPVNPFGAGLSASAATIQGVSGWEIDNIAENFNLGPSVFRTLVSGDISSGTVSLRLFYVKPNTTARTLFADTNLPLVVWAKNYGAAS